jgi:hypothetical protein
VIDHDRKMREKDAAAGRATAAKPTATTAKPKGDRWAILNGIVDVSLRDLTDAETKVWLVLYRDVRGGVARTGMSDIARRAGLERRSVVRAIERLKARGIVTRKARGTIDGRPNVYQLRSPT